MSPFEAEGVWLRCALHAHTTNSDGEMSPDMTLPDVWDDVAATLDRDAIQAALRAIPERQREALELAYFGGLTQVEIAGRLHLPLGTVKGRMRLGLLALRAELLAQGGGRG